MQLARSLGARVTAFFAAPPATPIVYKALLPVGYAAPEAHKKSSEAAVATSDFPADAILAAAR